MIITDAHDHQWVVIVVDVVVHEHVIVNSKQTVQNVMVCERAMVVSTNMTAVWYQQTRNQTSKQARKARDKEGVYSYRSDGDKEERSCRSDSIEKSRWISSVASRIILARSASVVDKSLVVVIDSVVGSDGGVVPVVIIVVVVVVGAIVIVGVDSSSCCPKATQETRIV